MESTTWKEKAIYCLKTYVPLQTAAKNLSHAIQELEYDIENFETLASPVIRLDPVQSNALPSDVIGRQVVAKKERLQQLQITFRLTLNELKYTTRALLSLTAEENCYLELFYMKRKDNACEIIRKKDHVSVSTVQRRKLLALQRFALARFGYIHPDELNQEFC